MFNKNFYPSPIAVIRRMYTLLDPENDEYILEPSAGKGDILDYLAEHNHSLNLYTIEIEPELRSILKDKGYSLVADNFLTYTPKIMFDGIIMNPPFDEAEEHILKAWGILVTGRIVCLVSTATLDGKTEKERTINRLIADHGCVEHVGSIFVGAERSTNVPCSIIVLNKTEQGGPKLEWDVVNDRETPEFEEGPGNQVALKGFVANLLSNFDAALYNYESYNLAREKVLKYTTVFENYDKNSIMAESDKKMKPSERYNGFVNLLQTHAWSKILDHPGFQAVLTDRARNMMQEFRQRQKRVDFNARNIQAMFEELMDKQKEFLHAALFDAFDHMTAYHKENRVYFEGWKTNDCWKVNKKVILPNHFEAWISNTLHMNYHYEAQLTDIDRALCLVAGMEFNSITTMVASIKRELDRTKGPSECVSTFFRMRYFKKGTLHLWFLNDTVWNMFNTEVAKARKWLPPGEGGLS